MIPLGEDRGKLKQDKPYENYIKVAIGHFSRCYFTHCVDEGNNANWQQKFLL